MYYYRRKTSKLKWAILIILAAVVGYFSYWFYVNYFSKIDFFRSEPNQAGQIITDQESTKSLLGNIYVMQGRVEIAQTDGQYAAAINEAIVHQGDKIKTGAKGLAIIKLADGTFIRLNNQTEIILSDLTDSGILIDQLAGRTYNLTKSQGSFTIKSLNVVVKASQNIFELIANKDEKHVAVLDFSGNLQVEVNDSQGLLVASRLIAGEKGLFDLKLDKNNLLKIEQFKKTDLAKETWYNWNFDLDNKIDQPIIVPVVEPDFSVLSDALQISGEVKDNKIELSWTIYNNKDNFKKYQLIKSETNQDLKYPDDGSIKSSTSISLAAYQDGQVETGKQYYYRICVIKTNDKVVCGNVINLEIKKDEPDTTPPATPNLLVSISAAGVNLTWTKNQEEDWQAYKILRSITNAKPAFSVDLFKTIGEKEQTTYLDNSVNITSVGNYYYRVCAVDTAGNNACSESRLITDGQVK
jgi:hypothetical protein